MKRFAVCIVLCLLSSPRADAAGRKGPVSLLIPIAGSIEGAFGTFWRTDLNLINHRDVPQPLTITFIEGGSEVDVDVILPPNSTTTYIDIVGSLFGGDGTGVIYINPMLSLGTTPFAPDADLDATYRIWTTQPGGTGTASQSSTALDLLALPYSHEPKTIIGVTQDADFRCSVGVVNLDVTRSFRVTASSPSGSVKTTLTVPSYSVAQVPLPAANLGYMTIVVEPLDGVNAQWTAFASSVDNHSGDSWLVDAMQQ